jgi:hypothetical protein
MLGLQQAGEFMSDRVDSRLIHNLNAQVFRENTEISN